MEPAGTSLARRRSVTRSSSESASKTRGDALSGLVAACLPESFPTMRPTPPKGHSPPRLAVVGGGLIVALMIAVAWDTLERRQPSTMQLETPNGVVVVEVADTPDARSAGLSNRESLAAIDGLLLTWHASGRHPIWMAEMRFPLDVAWIDSSGRVIAVLAGVPPCHRQPCPLYEPEETHHSIAVLELRAGAAANHGTTAGTSFETLRR